MTASTKDLDNFLLSFEFRYICLEMSNNIQLHKNDLPDDLDLGNLIAVDGEFMGLNVRRDPLCSNSDIFRKF